MAADLDKEVGCSFQRPLGQFFLSPQRTAGSVDLKASVLIRLGYLPARFEHFSLISLNCRESCPPWHIFYVWGKRAHRPNPSTHSTNTHSTLPPLKYFFFFLAALADFHYVI